MGSSRALSATHFSTDTFLSIMLHEIYLNLLTKLFWRALQELAV